MNTHKHKNKRTLFVALFLCVIAGAILAAYTASAATSISTDISTGALTTSDNHNYTLGGAKRISIDAYSTDTTLTTGVIDLNIDAASATVGVIGQDTSFALQGSTALGTGAVVGAGERISVTGPSSGLQTNNMLAADYLLISGNSNDAADASYAGEYIATGSTTTGAADYMGLYIDFTGQTIGTDMRNSGNATGVSIEMNRTSGAGNFQGTYASLDNTSSANQYVAGGTFQVTTSAGSGSVYGVKQTLTPSGTSGANVFANAVELTKSGTGSGYVYGYYGDINVTNGSTSGAVGMNLKIDLGNTSVNAQGLAISEDGTGSGQLQDGIFIDSNNSGSDGIVDGIDVSDVEITNAINVGNNTILANGSFSIDLKAGSNDTLSITNSDGGVASLSVEGDVSAAGGFKNTIGTWNRIDAAANLTDTQINIAGGTGSYEFTMPYAGSVVAICVSANASRSAGSLTMRPRINGSNVTGLTAVLDGSNTQYKCSTLAKDSSGANFSAGDRIDVTLTTSSDWAPTTADIVTTVVVEF